MTLFVCTGTGTGSQPVSLILPVSSLDHGLNTISPWLLISTLSVVTTMLRSHFDFIFVIVLVIFALSDAKSIFDFSAKEINGHEMSFSNLKHRLTLIVNVASYCGYTESHYKGLVDLWSEFEDTEALNILAFPCNQFGEQEPGTNKEIQDFAEFKGITFHMMEKINVNGPNASDFYKFLKTQAGIENIAWNFATYFLVEKDGTVHAFSDVEPNDLKGKLIELMGRVPDAAVEEL